MGARGRAAVDTGPTLRGQGVGVRSPPALPGERITESDGGADWSTLIVTMAVATRLRCPAALWTSRGGRLQGLRSLESDTPEEKLLNGLTFTLTASEPPATM